MGRETYLADLYRQSVQALTQNRTEWMGLLSSVSKYYKMSFDKNVLIYVQRPDAGLLATKMGWEKQTGRYLKAGSKGIGVVDMNNPKATLAYYFDLADTRGDYEGFRRAMSAVWSLLYLGGHLWVTYFICTWIKIGLSTCLLPIEIKAELNQVSHFHGI